MLHSRIKRVEDQYQKEIAKILAYDLRDPRIQMATPNHVKISKDLREAQVFVSVLPDDAESKAAAMEALESATGYIKRLLAKRLQLKRLPDPHFKLDESIGKAFEVYAVLDRIKEEKEESPEDATESPES